jgi:hypothetical protein
VKVWDAATGQEVIALKGHTDGVTSVCFSPDGQRLASASQDGTVKIWDAPRPAPRRSRATPPLGSLNSVSAPSLPRTCAQDAQVTQVSSRAQKPVYRMYREPSNSPAALPQLQAIEQRGRQTPDHALERVRQHGGLQQGDEARRWVPSCRAGNSCV